eukprot:PITA_32600
MGGSRGQGFGGLVGVYGLKPGVDRYGGVTPPLAGRGAGGGYGMGGFVGILVPPLNGGYGDEPTPFRWLDMGMGLLLVSIDRRVGGCARAGFGSVGVYSFSYGLKGLMGTGCDRQSPIKLLEYENGLAEMYPYGEGGFNYGAPSNTGGTPKGEHGLGGREAPHVDGMMNEHYGYGGGIYGTTRRLGQRGPDGKFSPLPRCIG